MYRGFNLRLDEWFDEDDDHQTGLSLYSKNKLQIRNTLRSFLNEDGSLNGSKMQENWFPQIEADVFISHSHNDEEMAISLAGWLYNNFGLKSFIDSCIWGNSEILLRVIDNVYCLDKDKKLYSYQKRNHSTSHIHMMLNTALGMMIDKTECLFFLNTPSSITTSEIIDQTESPWIYSEIAMSRLVRKKQLREYRREVVKFEKGGVIGESLMKVKYDLYLGHLSELNEYDLYEWQRQPDVAFSLDTLYELNP